MSRRAHPQRVVTVVDGVADDQRWRSLFAAVTLALASVPIVVAVTRAIATGWVPIFDAGYFTVRSRDVLTENHPWLGAWSSASSGLSATIRNLGPLQLDLLAPFTQLDPYWGTAVGVGVVAGASVFAVWWSARRLLGPIAAGGAMLATLALEAAIGSVPFIDPRQQVYLLMPYWALLWLTWATAMGTGAAVAPLVLVSSLILQTHFTFLFQTAVLVVAGLGCYVVSARGRWREVNATRSLLVGLAVGLVCWAQPLWDQLFGERNMGAVLAEGGTSEGVGWADGARTVAGTVLLPLRFWLPNSLDSFDLPADLSSPLSAWTALTVWLAVVIGAASVAWRRGLAPVAGLGVVAALALVAAVVAGAMIPLTAFGFTPQNYFWMWPTGVFLTVAVAAGFLAGAQPVRHALGSPFGAISLAAVSLVVAIAASFPADRFAPFESAETAGVRIGRPVVEQLAAGLRRHGVTGRVVVDHTRASFGNYVGYTVLVELQRAGIEFTFPADSRNVDRFGSGRCDDGEAVRRIVIADAGGDPVPRDGEVVLAHVDAFSAADQRELTELDRRFGDGLRDGTVQLDLPTVEYLAGGEVPGLRAVLTTAGLPATGLATALSPWTNWGAIEMPKDVRDEFDHWVDLQVGSALQDITILLADTPAQDDDGGPVMAGVCRG